MKHLEMSDDDVVRRVLDEADVAPSDQLESSLLALRSAGKASSVPEPSPELMVFMTTPATAPVVPLRRRRNVRGALMVAAALAGTGLGVSGVAAANPDFRTAADLAVQNVVVFFAPSAAGKTEAPGHAEQGVPAGIPAVPGQGEQNDDGGPNTGAGADSDAPADPDADSATESADPTAPGGSLAPGQQPETPGGNRSVKSDRNGAERDPAPPFRGLLPGAPPFDGTLPDPSRPDRPKDNPGKGLPLEDGSLPSPDPARIPELPVAPEPQR
ncbi:hypothetical protein [Arthrobacter sp.]|uniref:hypothetical protein n=1 Tax=Arthrobacter sp. TaxID=1667 RepID=UPI003395CC40